MLLSPTLDSCCRRCPIQYTYSRVGAMAHSSPPMITHRQAIMFLSMRRGLLKIVTGITQCRTSCVILSSMLFNSRLGLQQHCWWWSIASSLYYTIYYRNYPIPHKPHQPKRNRWGTLLRDRDRRFVGCLCRKMLYLSLLAGDDDHQHFLSVSLVA